eukprot:107209-Amorphochlora_amoeboformis.AAC.1
MRIGFTCLSTQNYFVLFAAEYTQFGLLYRQPCEIIGESVGLKTMIRLLQHVEPIGGLRSVLVESRVRGLHLH